MQGMLKVGKALDLGRDVRVGCSLQSDQYQVEVEVLGDYFAHVLPAPRDDDAVTEFLQMKLHGKRFDLMSLRGGP